MRGLDAGIAGGFRRAFWDFGRCGVTGGGDKVECAPIGHDMQIQPRDMSVWRHTGLCTRGTNEAAF